MNANSTNNAPRWVDRERVNPHHIAIPERVESAGPTLEITDNMTEPNRRDVERMLELYCQLEYFGIRASRSIVIDDSRVAFDIASASLIEMRDASRNDQIRTAVMAAPERRRVCGDNGRPVASVIRGALASQVVHPRGGHSAAIAQTDRSPQLWKATVAAKLAKLRKDQQRALLSVAILRIELVDVRNRLQAARTTVERLKHGRREARNYRRHAEDRRGELRSLEEMKSDSLKRLVRTSMYRDGADRLWYLCTDTPELRQYLFREG